MERTRPPEVCQTEPTPALHNRTVPPRTSPKSNTNRQKCRTARHRCLPPALRARARRRRSSLGIPLSCGSLWSVAGRPRSGQRSRGSASPLAVAVVPIGPLSRALRAAPQHRPAPPHLGTLPEIDAPRLLFPRREVAHHKPHAAAPPPQPLPSPDAAGIHRQLVTNVGNLARPPRARPMGQREVRPQVPAVLLHMHSSPLR